MTAPERIWVRTFKTGYKQATLSQQPFDPAPCGYDDAKYVRADLAAVTVGVKPDRETFDAMCAMRDAINEFVPMPSLESDLLQGPENSVFCSTVAEAVIAEIRRLRAALIPVTAPDPAAIREAALKEAASECQRIAGNTKDFHAYHRRAAGQCTSRILALIGEKKWPRRN